MEDHTEDGIRARRVRAMGATIGDTAEALGRAESRFVQTLGDLVGESTRAIGAAAARTVDEVRGGTGTLIDVAGDATARSIEATGRFTGVILDAGGAYVRELADVATEAAATTMEQRRAARSDHAHDDAPEEVDDTLHVVGPM